MAVKKSSGRIEVRRWRAADLQGLVDCHNAVYGSEFGINEAEDLRLFKFNLKRFREGQFVAICDGKIVGYACSIIVQLDDTQPYYKYSEITGDSTFSTHDPMGDTLYGADIAVRAEYRGLGIAGSLYKERKNLLIRYNLKRMVAHGRLPGYSEYAGKLTPEQYVEEVKVGRIKDSALNAHLKAGYTVNAVLMDQLEDRSSLNYATWLEMKNEKFSETKRRIAATPIRRPVRRVRVCAAQFEMRRTKDWQEFQQNVLFFVDTAVTYHAHLLVFPELFTVQLFSTMNPEFSDREAIEELSSKFTDRYIEMMSEQARQHGLYIVGGSHPTRREGKLYNTAYLFTPTGAYYEQDKLHVTPDERRYFNITPGDKIRVFDTPLARIAIVVCYDIEFPELTRLLVERGVEILVVPFSTDELKAYKRVRFSAHARAVENYVYVVLAGNVGNLPSVRSYLINYGQSAVITPSDFGFPVGSIEAEADPNTETVAIADLDVTHLLLQRDIGSVRPLFDRRLDLYDLQSKVPVELIRC